MADVQTVNRAVLPARELSTPAIAPRTLRILHGPAVLLVADKVKATRYYKEVLGFETDPCGEVMRDGLVLLLHEAARVEDVRPSSSVAGGPAWDFYAYAADGRGIDALYTEWKARGAVVVRQPRLVNATWKEFVIQDLDGYKIAFGANVAG